MENLSPPDQAFQLYERGKDLHYLGLGHEAAVELRQAHGIFKEQQRPEEAIRALRLAALSHGIAGENESLLCLQNARKLAEKEGLLDAQAAVYCDMGTVRRWRGQPELAINDFRASYDMLRNADTPDGQYGRLCAEYARTLLDLRVPYCDIAPQLEKAWQSAQLFDDAELEITALSYMGLLEGRLRTPHLATIHLQNALSRLTTQPRTMARQEAIIHGLLGQLHFQEAAAAAHTQQAQEYINSLTSDGTKQLLQREIMLKLG